MTSRMATRSTTVEDMPMESFVDSMITEPTEIIIDTVVDHGDICVVDLEPTNLSIKRNTSVQTEPIPVQVVPAAVDNYTQPEDVNTSNPPPAADIFDPRDVISRKKRKRAVPMHLNMGVIEFQFNPNPHVGGARRYTIASLSHYITRHIDKVDWISDIADDVRKLDIQRLYVVGRNTDEILRKHLPIEVRRFYRRERDDVCRSCRRLGCSVFKVQNILCYWFKYDFHMDCDD